MEQSNKEVALIYTIRRTDPWWRYVGEKMQYTESYTVSDLRGDGNFNVVDDFYRYQRQYYSKRVTPSDMVSCEEIEGVIARCRLLRFLPYRLARSMVLGMAHAMNTVLDQVKPTVVISFPIDRYVSDVLRLMASKRGIEHHEITVGPLPNTVMVLNRGRLRLASKEIDKQRMEQNIRDITDRYFKPSYVKKGNQYTKVNFFKKFFYFQLRGWAFKVISILKRDYLNLHYIDAQSFLGHKPIFSDHRVLDMVDQNWCDKLEAVEEDKRVFLGLSVFPEASIDYWIDDLKIIEYENLMVNIATELSNNGFTLFVKDHPLQFGFRQTDLIDRFLAIPNTILVPYDIDGKQLIAQVGVTVTTTGTIGLESSLIGKKSIVVENYYSTPEDFIYIDSYNVDGLAQRVKDFPKPMDLPERQQRVMRRLMTGSFDGDFFSFERYVKGSECEKTTRVSEAAREHLAQLMPL